MKDYIVSYLSPLKDRALDVARDLCLVRILLWSCHEIIDFGRTHGKFVLIGLITSVSTI